jgi:hypothetical protein
MTAWSGQGGVMARNSLYRTLFITSLFAAVGSFIIDLADVFSQHMVWLLTKLQYMTGAERDSILTGCRYVIAYAAAALVLVRVMRWWNGE